MLKVKDVEVNIFDRISAIQNKYPELIGVRVNVYEEYGLSRSFRQGSNYETLNRGVKEEVIDRNNRWRNEERAGVKISETKDTVSLCGCACCNKELHTIFTSLISEDEF